METTEYQRMFEAEEAQWWYAGMRAISFALLEGSLDGGRKLDILDAGCGTGAVLGRLAARGRAVGIDISAEALAFCRRRGVPAARAGLAELPFPDRAFDCVTSFDVLYHAWVADDRAAVREMARVLRPGGLLLVRVPALKLLWGAHDRAVRSRHRYSRAEVRALLEAAGFDVLRLSFCNTFLFPLLAVRRTLDRVSGRSGSDVEFLPAPLEWSFLRVLLLEGWLLRHGFTFPVGASLVALGRKRD